MRYHVYLMTNSDGCSPLMSTRPLPWRALRELPGLLVLPRGSYVRIEHALAVCEEIREIQEELAPERAWASQVRGIDGSIQRPSFNSLSTSPS